MGNFLFAKIIIDFQKLSILKSELKASPHTSEPLLFPDSMILLS